LTGNPYAIYRNLTGATLAGFELSLRYDVARAIGYDFSFSPYLDLTWLTARKNKDKITANALVTIAPDILSNTPEVLASFGIDFDYPGIGLSANLNASYIGERYVRDWYTAGYPWKVQPRITVVDLSFQKTLADFGEKGELSLKGQIGNFFDEDEGYAPDVLMPGRNFYLGLAYSF
jgi:outer membrane receptor protein involved in Fe transport